MLDKQPGTCVPDDWYAGFHTGAAARFWRAVGEQMADDDVATVVELLALPPGSRVLDVPCGDGRIALRLARRGFELRGVDLAAGEIASAAAAARREGLPASFAVGDMSRLGEPAVYDAVVCWGNSFGYTSHTGTLRTLEGFRRALRAGGRLVMETGTVAESLLAGGVPERDHHEAGGVRVSERLTYRPEESRLEIEYAFRDADGREERRASGHLVYTTGELVRMLHGAGFGRVELRGPDGRAPFELGSPRLMVVAHA